MDRYITMESQIMQEFRDSDLGMVRVIEDIIEVLEKKGLISLDELPEAAQKKILERRKMRAVFWNKNKKEE